MKALPKNWTKAIPKENFTECVDGPYGIPTAYWDEKGNFRMICLAGDGYYSPGWDYAGQEESFKKDYLPFRSPSQK